MSGMDSETTRMLDVIEAEASLTAAVTGRRRFKEQVMRAMASVERADFVPDDLRALAYDDGPLPIGCGQTISQPYIVALMTDVLDLQVDSVVLEVGTGSGYQAAVLSKLVQKVYSVEHIPELCQSASVRLRDLGYCNVETECRNGYYGWQEKAPFDAIIVTAAASHVPPPLVKQLKCGGRMVIPVGMPYGSQDLILIYKDEEGNTCTETLLAVSFVPLVSEGGQTQQGVEL